MRRVPCLARMFPRAILSPRLLRIAGPIAMESKPSGIAFSAITRLAILDLSERGRQPMPNADRSSWITYNGECYNAGELREWLVVARTEIPFGN